MRSFLTTAFLLCAAAAIPCQTQSVHLTTGVDGMVDYPFDPMFVPPTGLTVEAWVTFDDSTIPTGAYYWPTIARQNVTPQMETWNFRVSSSNTGSRSLQLIVRNSFNALNSVTYLFAPGEFANWTHLAATYNGTQITLFKNGVQVAQTTIASSEVQNLGGVTRIGNGDTVAPGRECWNGDLSEVRIWPFARTAAEITQTMNMQLSGLPGKVLTINLDGFYIETSHGLLGTPSGTIAFTANVPGLTPTTINAVNAGVSTTTCPRTIDTQIGSAPMVGNLDFAIWATRGPLPANSQLGIVVAATAPAPASQPPFLGVNLAFALPSVVSEIALLPPTTGLGNTRFGLPIPNMPILVGAGFYLQFGYADSQCGPQGFSSSDGLFFAIQ